MSLKTNLLSSGAFGGMTANERRLGRFIRDGEGHPAPAAPAPAPAAGDAGGDGSAQQNTFVGDHDDFSAFEAELAGKGSSDDGDGSGNDGPGASSDDDGTGAPPAGDDEGGSDDAHTVELAEAKKAADEARQRAEAAERELAELRRKAAPPAPAKSEGESSEEKAPNPEDYQFGEADPKFIADHARFHARQEFIAQQAQAEMRAELATVEAKWAEAVAKPELVERYPDFQEKVVKAADRGDWACSPLMALALKESDVGPDVAYHLASNPAESLRIAKLHPLEQAREFGRLEGRYSAERATKPAAPAAKVASDAPPPPPGRARGAGGKFATPADTDDFSAFESMADGVLKSRR